MSTSNSPKRPRLSSPFALELLTAVLVSSAAAGTVGCSGSDGSGTSAGGTNGIGGKGGGLGGSATTGGTLGASGGASAGGVTAAGGMPATGGLATTGGAMGTGGNSSTGGAATTGGVLGGGGTLSTGGSPATGGVQSTGGTKATGGTPAMGGNSPTGGSKATGGVPSTGGTSSTGGTKTTGGVAATGGNPATGGTTTAGGTSSCTTPPAPSALIGWASVSGSSVTTTTGGGNLTPTVVTTLASLNTAAAGTTARVIYVQGNLSGTVTIGSNKTIVGICGATITGHIGMNGSVNVIFRNIQVVGLNCTDSPSDCSAGADAITVYGAHHIWFDHIDVSDGSDGNLDITQASDFVTVSWSKFSYSSKRTDPAAGASGHRFSNLIGASDNNAGDVGKLNVTWHHIWWADNVDQRMPRVRYGKIHVFNSLYTTTGNNYCIGVGMAASMRDENNVFIGSSRPVNSSSFADATTTLISVGNIYTNTTGGTAADIPTAFTPTYPYSLDAASTVQAAVQAGVGPK